MIGTDIIAKMYKGYLEAQIVNDLQQKTELVLEQISKRLKYRIKASTVAKQSDSTPIRFKKLSNDDGLDYNMLEWIGYDNEGFLGVYNGGKFKPAWSGFVDLYDFSGADKTSKTQVSTKGSILSSEDNIVKALSNGEVDISGALQDSAIIFKKFTITTPESFGLHPTLNTHTNTYRVRRNGDNILTFSENVADKILYEQYWLAWSAYAIVPNTTMKDDDFNLTLHYNYQPWYGEKFNSAGTKTSVLAEHVSTFRFTQVGNTIRLKLCIGDDNITGVPITFCKERAVY
jgi:hypothetical protein